MDKLVIYCVAGIHTAPVEMTKNEDGSFSREICLPLPDQINVFMVGDQDHFSQHQVIDIQFYYEGVEFKLGSLTKATRNVVWERKKCDDTLPELLKNSCVGIVRLEGLIKQVMGNTAQNRPAQHSKARKRKTADIQEELENTPQPPVAVTPVSNKKKPNKVRGKDSHGERTPKGPTPRKSKIATRMRAFRGDNKPSAAQTNTQTDSQTDSQTLDSHLRLSVCKDVTCTETRRWKPVKTEVEGQNPELRMGHTATYDPIVRCIYVYGGSKNLKWFRDVYTLDLNNWKWQLMKVNGKAPMRAYHTATLYRHELWIFGGVFPLPNPQPDGCSNDLHIFSPVMESWYSPIVTGKKPLARSGHSSTMLGDQLVVFGGWDAPFCYSDTFILDMTLLEWSQPKITGSPPKPRSWHASCALSGDRVLIHGGYDGDLALNDSHIFSLSEKSWSHIKMDSLPSPKTGHVALCLPYYHQNQGHDEVLVFGGGDNDGAFFDDLLSMAIPLKPLIENS